MTCPLSPARSFSGSAASSTSSNASAPKTPKGDRFIPSRGAMDMDVCQFNLKENAHPNDAAMAPTASPSKKDYQDTLATTLLDGRQESKILAFKHKAPAPSEGHQSDLRVLYSQNKLERTHTRKQSRHISQVPERILDAPELFDDYYLNLLDWSKSNLLAVALGQSVYLWNASSGTVEELFQTPDADNMITSVSWIEGGTHLAVGTTDADVQLWDVEQMKQVRSMKGHMSRVSSLAWNQHILSSGSRDSLIFNHDVRQAEHRVATLKGHEQEVCGLKWSPDGTQLASGGNDNLLHIWDAGRYEAPKFRLTDHQAAVKALAWCPWQSNLLASGGGTADRMMRFWNTSTGACVNSVDTKSQVCSLVWSREYKEIVSSHGFSQNQLCVWKYPSLVKTAELTGHSSRVLHMSLSPDGTTIASAAADETLRFWKVFAKSEAQSKKADGAAGAVSSATRAFLKRTSIR